MAVELLFKLPWEVLLRVCSYLDPESLNNFALSSDRYKILLHDDLAWRAAFVQHYRKTEFTSIAGTWILEYKLRSTLLRKYQRNRGHNLLFDAKIGNVSVLFHDSAINRILCGNTRNGLVAVASSITGRVAKDLIYPARNERITTSDICVLMPSKNFIAYGFRNGRVAVNSLTKSTAKADFRLLKGFHTSSISCLVGVTGLHIQDHPIQLVSGSMDGQIKFWTWNVDVQDCLGSLNLLSPIVALHWFERKSMLFVLVATQLLQVRYDQHSGFISIVLGQWQQTQIASDMFVDQFASMVVVAIESRLVRFKFPADQQHFVEDSVLLTEVEGTIGHLVIDDIDEVRTERSRPGAGARLCAFSSGLDRCTISILNSRSTNWPTSEKQIVVPVATTALALNAIVLVSGHIDGSVLVHDLLESGQSLRQISSRIAKFDRIALEDPLRTHVTCIKLDPQSRPAGVVAIGGQIRAFDFEPRNGLVHGKRKDLGKKRHIGSRSSAVAGNAYSQEDIDNELLDMESGRQLNREDKGRLKKYGGTLSSELQESELLSYVSFLSMEDSRASASHDGQSEGDKDLAEAMKRSLLTSEETASEGNSHELPQDLVADEALSYDEAYALTIALSQSMVP